MNLIRKYFHNIAEAIDCHDATAFKNQCDADGPSRIFARRTASHSCVRCRSPSTSPIGVPHDKNQWIKQILKIPRSTEGPPLERDENDSDSDVAHEINLDVDDHDDLDPSYQIVNFDEEYAKTAALSKQTGWSVKKAPLFLKGRGQKGKEQPKKKHKRRSARRAFEEK